MKTVFFDSGDPEVYFDNPNLIWGEPSYLLGPGDHGYSGFTRICHRRALLVRRDREWEAWK